jgi:SAM-dependent methyltransferase
MLSTDDQISRFWDSKFSESGSLWGDLPSDSAIYALKIFREEGLLKLLVPGAGYGRNASFFEKNGFNVTGIELSGSAIQLARKLGVTYLIHCGSVLHMPFDAEVYDGIFCYALLHLFNKTDRNRFIQKCRDQLRPGGQLFFTVVSRDSYLFGQGTRLDPDTFEIFPGIQVYFYDLPGLISDFSSMELLESGTIDEPIKYMEGQEPLKCLYIRARA